jgi:antirestriction protein
LTPNHTGSYRTKKHRHYVLHKMIRDLFHLGCVPPKWHAVTYEHIQRLVIYWQKEKLHHSTIFAAFIDQHGELGAALLSDYSLEEAENLINEAYFGAYESEDDFARTVFEECYNAIPENLKGYFDYEAYARDLFINDFFAVEASSQTHVFSN